MRVEAEWRFTVTDESSPLENASPKIICKMGEFGILHQSRFIVLVHQGIKSNAFLL